MFSSRFIIMHCYRASIFVKFVIFVGQADTVRCYYCDGGLRKWERSHIPWEEHARWFPFCEFVIKMKGRKYIDSVQKQIQVNLFL